MFSEQSNTVRHTASMLAKMLSLAALASVVLPGTSLCQTALALGEHNVVLNGVRLWYEVAGQRQAGEAPVVFLHGGPGYNSYSFQKTIGPRLERHALMIYLDERGAGHSERPWTGAYDMPTLVQDVEALRQSLDLPSISLMGHSFGGTITLEYASRYSEHVQKLIILDGAADIPKSLDLWRTQLEQRYPDAWRGTLSGDKGKSYLQATSGNDSCVIARIEFAAEMELTMPVLVIVGKYDRAVGVEQMQYMADHLPHARFDEFNQSAHFVYAEEPDKFEHDVVEFLAGR